MVRVPIIRPVNTDKQADKAAQRDLREQVRLSRINTQEEAEVARWEAKIAEARQKAAAKRADIGTVRVPLNWLLLRFANKVRGRQRKYRLPSGIELEVFSATRVVAVTTDKAAIEELKTSGHPEFVRERVTVVEEVDRAGLRKRKNQHIVEAMESLNLVRSETLKIHPPK